MVVLSLQMEKAWLIDEDGDVTVFDLSPEKRLLTEVAMETSGYSNLAAANQTLFIATKTHLFAAGPPIPSKSEQAQGTEKERQRLVATLPGGMEVELVGVTRNTARSQQGWAPDGSSIGEIPDWNPSKVLIHEGNTTGFRTEEHHIRMLATCCLRYGEQNFHHPLRSWE